MIFLANYPDWVMKYKEKGTYINYVNGKYYLYAAHSERIPGTKKVKRVFDRYIGRITEEEGLIPTRDKVSGNVIVYEYGLSTLLLTLSKNIHKGFKRTFKDNADFIMAATILTVMYGRYNNNLFLQSFLSIRFPDINMEKATDKQKAEIDRGVRMLKHEINEKYGADTEDVLLYFRHLYKVKINDQYYLSEETDKIVELKSKYKIEWRD